MQKERNKRKLILVVGSAAAIAVVACVVVYFELPSKERARKRIYQRALQEPAMAKWLRYFKVDASWTHPFKILRIDQDPNFVGDFQFNPGLKRFLAETSFSHDFLERERWNKTFPTGKFYLVINNRIISTGCDGATTNGDCLFRFDERDLEPGTNHMRVDILVDNPSGAGGWILAEGPSTELVFTNGFR